MEPLTSGTLAPKLLMSIHPSLKLPKILRFFIALSHLDLESEMVEALGEIDGQSHEDIFDGDLS